MSNMILTFGFQKDVAVHLIFGDAMTAGAPTVNAVAAAAVPIPAFFKNVRLSMIPPLSLFELNGTFF